MHPVSDQFPGSSDFEMVLESVQRRDEYCEVMILVVLPQVTVFREVPSAQSAQKCEHPLSANVRILFFTHGTFHTDKRDEGYSYICGVFQTKLLTKVIQSTMTSCRNHAQCPGYNNNNKP